MVVVLLQLRFHRLQPEEHLLQGLGRTGLLRNAVSMVTGARLRERERTYERA